MAKIQGVLVVPFEFDEEDWKTAYDGEDVKTGVTSLLTNNGDGPTEYLTALFASDSGAKATGATMVWENVHTRTEVSKAMNAAADRVQEEAEYENESSVRMQDGVNLTVNLALGWLDNPGHTAERIIVANYDLDDYEDEENNKKLNDEQRRARKDAYTVRKVLSWVA